MMCFVTGEAYAYDIAVENGDGVTIYYYCCPLKLKYTSNTYPQCQ